MLFSFNRKTQPGQGDAKRPVHLRRKKPAPVAPSTALRERSGPPRANKPVAANDEVLELRPGEYETVDDVLELGPDDFDPIPDALPVPRAAERKAAAATHDWPRLEL